MEMSLLDLIGRIECKPVVEMLGLKAKEAVPGLFCILNKDLNEVKAKMYKAFDQNLNSHVKFKMYGDEKLDLKIAKLARSVLGKDSFIMSDVNKGYKEWGTVTELSNILVNYKRRAWMQLKILLNSQISNGSNFKTWWEVFL